MIDSLGIETTHKEEGRARERERDKEKERKSGSERVLGLKYDYGISD